MSPFSDEDEEEEDEDEEEEESDETPAALTVDERFGSPVTGASLDDDESPYSSPFSSFDDDESEVESAYSPDLTVFEVVA